jgi:hypothetical protein
MPENNSSTAEIFLVIKNTISDNGTRPLTGDFASSNVSLSGNTLSVAVTNLGTRATYTTIVELCAFPNTAKIVMSERTLLGIKQLPTINIGETRNVNFTISDLQKLHQDVLIVQAYEPIFDPLLHPCDPVNDRHVGQWGYPFSGYWAGTVNGQAYKISIGEPSILDRKYPIEEQHLDGSFWQKGVEANEAANGRTLCFKHMVPMARIKYSPTSFQHVVGSVVPASTLALMHNFGELTIVGWICLAEWKIVLRDNNSAEATIVNKINSCTETFNMGRTV